MTEENLKKKPQAGSKVYHKKWFIFQKQIFIMMEKFKSKGLTPEKYQGKKRCCSSAAHHHLGCLVTEAQQYNKPQRAIETREELTKGMEIKGNSHVESQHP